MNKVAVVTGPNQGLGFALVEALCRSLGPDGSVYLTARGWPERMNVPSRVAQAASMKIMARMMKDEAERRGGLLNAVCPELMDTEASRSRFKDASRAQSPEKAARGFPRNPLNESPALR